MSVEEKMQKLSALADDVAFGGFEETEGPGRIMAAVLALALAVHDECYGLAHGLGGSQADWDEQRARLEALLEGKEGEG